MAQIMLHKGDVDILPHNKPESALFTLEYMVISFLNVRYSDNIGKYHKINKLCGKHLPRYFVILNQFEFNIAFPLFPDRKGRNLMQFP